MQPDHIVYVVDPDEAIGEALTALLGTYDVRVRTFPDAESFLAANPPANLVRGCLLVEADLPGLSGAGLLKKLRVQGFTLPVIVLTNTANRHIRQQVLQLGATDVLEKPLINGLLVERLSELLPG